MIFHGYFLLKSKKKRLMHFSSGAFLKISSKENYSLINLASLKYFIAPG